MCFYPVLRMREARVMWSVCPFFIYLFVPTQNRESQQVPVYGDWKATVASIIEIHRCQGFRKQPSAAV